MRLWQSHHNSKHQWPTKCHKKEDKPQSNRHIVISEKDNWNYFPIFKTQIWKGEREQKLNLHGTLKIQAGKNTLA